MSLHHNLQKCKSTEILHNNNTLHPGFKKISNSIVENKINGIPISKQNQYHVKQPQYDHFLHSTEQNQLPRSFHTHQGHLSQRTFIISPENDHHPQNQNNILEIYKLQNNNLREQNVYLIEQLRKFKKKQIVLYQHIDRLSSELQNYRESQPTNIYNKSSIRKENKLQDRISVTVKANPKQASYHSKSQLLQEGNRLHRVLSQQEIPTNLQNMNREFCKVMDQCAKQTNIHKKNVLRQSLANLANQMKQVRKTLKI